MSILNDWAHVTAAIDQGRSMVDRCRDYRSPPKVKERLKAHHKIKKEYQRCPTCGGMVILPCLFCSLERRK